MTDSESKALLELANSWEEASKAFDKAKRRAASFARSFQEKGDFVKRDTYGHEAAMNEIRANLLLTMSRKLALKVGELLAKSSQVDDRSRNLRETGTRRSSSKSGVPKGPEPFVGQRHGEVA